MVKHTPLSGSLLFLGLVWLCMVSQAFASTITAGINRNPVAENESVTYRLTIKDPGKGEPDWSPLEKQFEILSRRSSTNMQVRDGRTSHSRTFQLVLMPKTTGTITIPAIQVGREYSNPIDLVVTPADKQQQAQDGRDLYLEVAATPNAPYLNAQVLLTARLFIGLPISQGALSEPNIEGAAIEKLGEDKQYAATRGRRQYQVIERRYALFPEQAGPLTIPPLVFEGTVGHRHSLFDAFDQAGPVQRVHSKAITLTVQPAPENAPSPWLPAAEMQGSITWSEPPDQAQAGIPITATIRITAKNLPAKFLPEPQPQSDTRLRTYSDQPQWQNRSDSQGVIGTVEKKITFLASQEGTYTIAPLRITYWNTSTHQADTLTIGEQTLHVQAAPGQPPSFQPKDTSLAPSANNLPPSPDIRPRSWQEQAYWFWISCLLTAGWVITGCAWWLRRRKGRGLAPSGAQAPPGPGTRNSELRRACLQNDAQTAHRLLSRDPFSTPDNDRQENWEERAEYARQKALLDRHLYAAAPPADPWDGAALYRAWKALQSSPARSGKKNNNPLPPLYD